MNQQQTHQKSLDERGGQEENTSSTICTTSNTTTSTSSSTTATTTTRTSGESDGKDITAHTATCNRGWIQSLPKPEVPDLDTSLVRYCDGLRPVIPRAQFEQTQRTVSQFLQGEGRQLQQHLLQFANQCDNWVTQLWIDDMYLNNPTALPVNSSPFYLLPKQTFRTTADQIKYAARVVEFCYKFREKIERQTLTQEYASGHGSGRPLCMQTYNNFFGSCRLPGEKKDHLLIPKKDHFVIACKNQFFSVHLNEGERMCESTLVEVLRRVVSSAKETNSPPVGLFTSENRRTWWAVRNRLIELGKENISSLEQLQDCAFVLCLDDQSSVRVASNRRDSISRARMEPAYCAYQLLTGGGSSANSGNRWYDKFLNFVVNKDGICGAVIEHTGSEGITVIRFLHELLDFLENGQVNSNSIDPALRKMSLNSFAALDKVYHHLSFKLDEQLLKSLEEASRRLDKLLEDVDLFVVEFREFGKEFIKKQKMSPDAFIQLSLQLTYYKVHRKLVSSYESAGLRQFRLGRVDNIRSCTMEALHWARAMCDEIPDVTEPQKVDFFKAAMAKQVEILKFTIAGNGPDNHLLGLREMSRKIRGDDLCPLFKEKAYKEFLNFKLSTSQLPSRQDILIGYGAVVNDGYGCSYNPTSEKINFVITSFHSCSETSSDFFARSLEGSLLQMREICYKMQETN